MAQLLAIAKSAHELRLLPGLANRHVLINGATCTGKTVTLRTMAEAFSSIGVLVFMADVKGDLAGLSQAGVMNRKLKERIDKLASGDFAFAARPTVFGDVLGSEFGGGSSRRQSPGEVLVKSAPRAVASEVGRQIVRGMLGSILGGSGRRR